MAAPLTIGRVAKRADCNIQTIRYYEQIGLMPPPERSSGNQRLYDMAAIRRLAFIRRCRELGFALDAIRQLLDLADHPDQPCATIDEIARARRADITARIKSLQKLEAELAEMIARCHADRVAECRILEALSNQHPEGAQ